MVDRTKHWPEKTVYGLIQSAVKQIRNGPIMRDHSYYIIQTSLTSSPPFRINLIAHLE
jgi:hypothetical protein